MTVPALGAGAGLAVPTLSSLSPVITAIVAVLAAWKLFEPKFARIRAIKTEMGSLEPAFWSLYVLPQRLMSAILWAIALFLLLLFLLPLEVDWFVPAGFVRGLVREENIIWVSFISGVIAAAIYWNLATYVLLWLTAGLSFIPIRSPLWGWFGPYGASPGWHQARAVCEGPDKGTPLLIDSQELDRVGSLVLARLAGPADKGDYAVLPAHFPPSVKANIGLFACILEAEYNANGWDVPGSAELYDFLADMQKRAGIFSPATLTTRFAEGAEFFEALRTGLDRELGRRNQPKPPNRALAAEPAISKAWELLSRRWHGDVLSRVPSLPNVLDLRLYWFDRRLRKFPRLDSDSMRTQFIKLLFRWGTLPSIARRSFGQPLARVLAWLLLEEGALRTLPELKEVTFYGAGEIPVARIAARRVIRTVAELVRAGGTSEARAVQRKWGTDLLILEEEADYVFWNWADKRARQARQAKWKNERWKFENGRASQAG